MKAEDMFGPREVRTARSLPTEEERLRATENPPVPSRVLARDEPCLDPEHCDLPGHEPDVMQRARLARGGRGGDGPMGKFEAAAKGLAPTVTTSVRGSDDDYCSATPEGHQYGSISVDAAPIKWVEQCISCNHISSRRLLDQLNQQGPMLGLATTAMLLEELEARMRIGIHGSPMPGERYAARMIQEVQRDLKGQADVLNYRTVDDV